MIFLMIAQPTHRMDERKSRIGGNFSPPNGVINTAAAVWSGSLWRTILAALRFTETIIHAQAARDTTKLTS